MAQEFKGYIRHLHWSSKAKIILDNLRVVPRILISLYGFICWDTHVWFKSLPDPTASQSAYVSLIWGAAAVWFAFYINSGQSTAPSNQLDEDRPKE